MQILIYNGEHVVLTVEHGITLGLLKYIYLSEKNVIGSVVGVKTRIKADGSFIPTVILSDDRMLDDPEYELILQGMHNLHYTSGPHLSLLGPWTHN